MKNTLRILVLSLLFVGCQQKIKPTEIAKINGYRMNENFDYFQIGTNNKGFRKKVMPQLNGTFLVNDTYENVVVRFANDKAYLDYSTPYMKWTEELIALSDEELVLVNAEKKEYHYKKTGAINLLDDGKETK
jgi:hypothetical protein